MNKVIIAVSDLKSALPGFSRIINKRTTLPVLGCILFQSKPGQLQLTGTNLDDFATYTVQSASALPPMEVLIPFEPLAKILKGCNADDTVTISTDKKQLGLTYPVGSSSLEQKLEFIAIDEFPPIPQEKEFDSITVGQEFKEAILNALSCASSNESRQILQNAFIDVTDPKAHYIVGTDGRHLFSANSFTFDLKESFTIPNRRFITWKGFVEDGDWKITLPVVEKDKAGNDKPAYVKVQSNHWTLITRRCDLPYPNWRAPIPHPDQEKTIVTFNDEAMEFVRKAVPRIPGSDQLNKGVTISADSSVLLFGNDGVQAVSIPVHGAVAEGRPVNISLNRDLLLKAMEMQLKELHIYDPMVAMVFTCGGKRLVVMPLRPDGPSPQPKETNPPPAPTQSSSSSVPVPSNNEEQTSMKTNNRIEEVSTETATNGAAMQKSAFEQVQDKLEQTRTAMKEMITDLGDCLKLLAQAQRERRSAEKEIEEVRTTLQSLQKIRI